MSKAKAHHPPRGSSKASLVQNQWRALHHRALRARRPRPPCRTLQTPQVTSYHRTRSANRGHCLLTARCGCKVGACKCLKPVSQKVANYFLCWKNFVRLAWRETSSASRQSASLCLLAPAVLTRMTEKMMNVDSNSQSLNSLEIWLLLFFFFLQKVVFLNVLKNKITKMFFPCW